MNHLSTAQLATYLGVTKRTIQRRSNREKWPFIVDKGLGGTRHLYAFETLPASIKNRVIAQIITKHRQYGAGYLNHKSTYDNHTKGASTDVLNSFIVANTTGGDGWLAQHIFAEQFPHPLDASEHEKEYMKIGVLELAYLYVANFTLGKIRGFDEFCKLYNSRQIALKAAIYQVISRVSRITLLRWEKQLQQSGKQHLINDASDKQITTFDKDLIQIAQELLMTTPNLTAKSLKQYFVIIFPERRTPDEERISAWLKQQKQVIENETRK